MKINVTREDIRNGKAGKPTACMVALALKRELGISYASVGYRDAKILVDGQYVKLYFPKSVEKKIRFWDGFHFVFPFSFDSCRRVSCQARQSHCGLRTSVPPLV